MLLPFEEKVWDRIATHLGKQNEKLYWQKTRVGFDQNPIGHILTHAPADPNGLWIHEAVATVLNFRDTEEMRSGFTTELFNQRGTYSYTAGRQERELAQLNRDKAEALRSKGYSRFATAMREFAEGYGRQAEREAERDIFHD